MALITLKDKLIWPLATIQVTFYANFNQFILSAKKCYQILKSIFQTYKTGPEISTYAYRKAGMQHAKTIMMKVATATTKSTAHRDEPVRSTHPSKQKLLQ